MFFAVASRPLPITAPSLPLSLILSSLYVAGTLRLCNLPGKAGSQKRRQKKESSLLLFLYVYSLYGEQSADCAESAVKHQIQRQDVQVYVRRHLQDNADMPVQKLWRLLDEQAELAAASAPAHVPVFSRELSLTIGITICEGPQERT